MDCPKCHQPSMPTGPTGQCPLCGFELLRVQQQIMRLYVLSSAIAGSVIVYGLAVFLLEQQGYRPALAALPTALPYGLLVLGVLVVGVAVQRLGREVVRATTVLRLRTLTIVRLTLAEAVAIFGLVLYLLSGSLQWFATFVGLSFLAFMLLAAQMPAVVRRMGELLVAEDQTPGG